MDSERGCPRARAGRSSNDDAPRVELASRPETALGALGVPMKRRNRLSRAKDFDTVYRRGRSVSTRFLVLYAFPRGGDGSENDEEPRLGLAVARRIGGAVERNRIKRQLRAAFDELREDIPGGTDYVVIVRPGLAETAEARGFAWLTEQVRDVFGQLRPVREVASR
jgi:ribonuclease P protein component